MGGGVEDPLSDGLTTALSKNPSSSASSISLLLAADTSADRGEVAASSEGPEL